MAKGTKVKHESGKIVKNTMPSSYGSHRSMVICELEDGMVRCKDDVGEYTTFADRLDTGLADARRWDRKDNHMETEESLEDSE